MRRAAGVFQTHQLQETNNKIAEQFRQLSLHEIPPKLGDKICAAFECFIFTREYLGISWVFHLRRRPDRLGSTFSSWTSVKRKRRYLNLTFHFVHRLRSRKPVWLV